MTYNESDFPRLLSLLRKEKDISQKDAAKCLFVSQALLSHYEKGIRRPSFEFVITAADYYDVSCDYLLGRVPSREGQKLTVEDIPDPDNAEKGNRGIDGVLVQLNKKLIANSQNILFDLLTKVQCKELTSEVSNYLMLAIYRMLRVIYSTDPSNKDEMFSLPEHVYAPYADARMQIAENDAKSIATGKIVGKNGKKHKIKGVGISVDQLERDYPLFASSIFNLIQNTENRIISSKDKKNADKK